MLGSAETLTCPGPGPRIAPVALVTLSSLSLVALLAASAGESEEDGPANWRFRDDTRPIKVSVIAGSVGAFPQAPYHQRLEKVCKNVEVKNLSKTGIGAFAMKQRFRDQVIKNSNVQPKKAAEGEEYWVFVASGVNSIGMPMSTNHHLKNLIVLAHINDMKAVALSPTPWGSEGQSKHRGLEGLKRRKATQLVTDFLTGKLDAEEALGEHASKRPAGASAKWDPIELPDIAVNVYDSPLRASDGKLRDLDKVRAELEGDRQWQRDHADLDETARAAALEADAKLASEIPRWFMKPKYKAFDDVHPNTDGHRIIAEQVCPKLPANWGCDCAALAKE
jgi:hypothetical protein